MADGSGEATPEVISKANDGGQQPAPRKRRERKVKRRLTSLAGVPDEELLRPDEVAAILGDSSADKASDKIATGAMRGGIRYGGRFLIRARDVRKYLEDQTIGFAGPLTDLLERGRRNRDARAHGPGPTPAEMNKYEARMSKLVAAGHLSDGEAQILQQLKANGINLSTDPRGRFRSV